MLENSTIRITLMAVGAVLAFGYFIFITKGFWRIFEYSGFPGWMCLVPILNLAILFKIAKMSPYWLFGTIVIVLTPYQVSTGNPALVLGTLMIIPIIYIIWLFKIASAFERDSNFVLFSLFFGFITIPLIGYGEKKYNLD